VSQYPRQRGVILFFVLIVLVAMSMAAISMFRSTDTGTMIAGNLAFKQSAVTSADVAAEAARTWVRANVNALGANNPAAGYYAMLQENLDLMGTLSVGDPVDDVDWDGTNTSAPTKAVVLAVDSRTGNQISYVVHRLCTQIGPVSASGTEEGTQMCSVASMNATGSTNDAARYDLFGMDRVNVAYLRITARIVGPRNTVTYAQSFILP
jgi:type IV pilus assembly protein PilX